MKTAEFAGGSVQVRDMEEPVVCDLVRKGLICAEGGAYKNLWKGQVVPSDNPSSGSHTLRQFKVQCNDL